MLLEPLQQYPVLRDLDARFGDAVLGGSDRLNDLAVIIDPVRIVDVCRFLKNEQKFVRLSGITGVDWLPETPRFELVYFLHSLERKERLRLKCRVAEEQPEIDSVISVWRGAMWYEREVFDMFGVVFRNNPGLKRILMPEDWEGYPLRKDYPIHGYKYSYQNE